MKIRDWGSVGQLDLKRPVVKSVEATSDRLNNERLRTLPLTLIFKPESSVTFYFVLASDKCTDLIDIVIICCCFFLSLITCYSFIFTAEFHLFSVRLFITTYKRLCNHFNRQLRRIRKL